MKNVGVYKLPRSFFNLVYTAATPSNNNNKIYLTSNNVTVDDFFRCECSGCLETAAHLLEHYFILFILTVVNRDTVSGFDELPSR